MSGFAHSAPAHETAAAADAVLAHVEQIVASPAFRSSRRCQKLLSFTVQELLQGRSEELKERTIGIAVFGRRPDYDTSEDSSVRVTAGEVRKRLAQYYVENTREPIRIELPAGSYVPVIRRVPADEAAPAPAPPAVAVRGLRRVYWALAAAVLLGAAAIGAFSLRTSSPSFPALDAFWNPVVGDARQVLVCLGGQFTYMPKPDLARRILSRVPVERDIESAALDPRPTDAISGSDLRASIDEQVATGDAHATALVGQVLGRMGKDLEFRLSYTSTLSDLQRTPAVFVGAFNNRWSIAANDALPFVYAGDWVMGTHRIRERNTGREWRFEPADATRRYPVEYALITRVLHPPSGRPFVQFGGFGQAGTLAAGQHLTSERMFGELSRSLTAGWEKKNLQVLLKVTVVKGHPAETTVIAHRSW